MERMLLAVYGLYACGGARLRAWDSQPPASSRPAQPTAASHSIEDRQLYLYVVYTKKQDIDLLRYEMTCDERGCIASVGLGVLDLPPIRHRAVIEGWRSLVHCAGAVEPRIMRGGQRVLLYGETNLDGIRQTTM